MPDTHSAHPPTGHAATGHPHPPSERASGFTHGGARPGAGGPPGPRPETLARLARLREAAHLDALGEDISHLSNLDLIQLQIWRLWNRGLCGEATELAFRLLPYHHSRKPTVTVSRAEPPETEAASPPEPLPPPARPSTPRPRAPRSYESSIEEKLARWVRWERIRRAERPEIPTRIPPLWREEIDCRLARDLPDHPPRFDLDPPGAPA